MSRTGQLAFPHCMQELWENPPEENSGFMQPLIWVCPFSKFTYASPYLSLPLRYFRGPPNTKKFYLSQRG